MARGLDLSAYGLSAPDVLRNASVALLYEDGVVCDGELMTSSGALATNSGDHTARSPRDKRIVEHPESAGDIWWGSVNTGLSGASFESLRRQAIDYFNTCGRIYVVDGYIGWDPTRRIKVRVFCARPYHALFMHNMLIRPTQGELAAFGKPDCVIYNAGQHPAEPKTPGVCSATSVSLDFERGEMVILGTEYAGEMKEAIFTWMNYLMPKQDVLSLHCAANVGPAGDVSLLFGLSGSGKTTLSADPQRQLVGDDEHCWSDDGVFNIEGGCYARCIRLSPQNRPRTHAAIRFGTILENVVVDPLTRVVDFDDASLTENTRASYPIEFISHARIPCVVGHPSNVIFLSCDAFGVLPPVSRLMPEQAMYHFISGYTAKMAGTEGGVSQPQATFSACFGAAFLAWHPTKYAQMLAERLRKHKAQAWLVNTGWSGGGYGSGERIPLDSTRAILDSIHSGELLRAPTVSDPIFGFDTPTHVTGVPAKLLQPEQAWRDPAAYRQAAERLAGLYQQNFQQFAEFAGPHVAAAGPRLAAVTTS